MLPLVNALLNDDYGITSEAYWLLIDIVREENPELAIKIHEVARCQDNRFFTSEPIR